MSFMRILKTDVLVIGAGGAGMYASIAAANADANVILCDKSLISRGRNSYGPNDRCCRYRS